MTLYPPSLGGFPFCSTIKEKIQLHAGKKLVSDADNFTKRELAHSIQLTTHAFVGFVNSSGDIRNDQSAAHHLCPQIWKHMLTSLSSICGCYISILHPFIDDVKSFFAINGNFFLTFHPWRDILCVWGD